MELHDYQKRAVEFALEKKASYMAVDLGLGKTAIALKVIEQLRKRWGNATFVFAPLRVIYSTWPDEIKKWTPGLTYQILHGPHKKEKLNYKADIYLINYDGIKWLYDALTEPGRTWRRTHVIFDESSFLKSHSTKRFKILKKLSLLFTPYRMCLSATPAPNGYHELWSQYYLMDEGASLGKVFTHFRDRFFWYSGPPLYKTVIRQNAGREILQCIRNTTFRLESKDYLTLPECIYNEIPVELPSEVYKKYKRLEKDFYLEIAEQDVSAFSAAALSMKLRQFIQGGIYIDGGGYEKIHSCKIDVLKELFDSAAGNPILVPIQFKFEYELICKAFRTSLPVIAGRTSARQSMHYIEEWNQGNIPLLLCHPASIGHGLNLQAAGHVICWFGLTWSLEQYKQLIGRIYRQGQKNAVTVHHIIAKGTIDQRVLTVLRQKDATQQDLLDALKKGGFDVFGNL
jgi:SNF2 family DNA or RNA helicase